MISDNYVTGDNIYLRELQNFFFEVLGMMSVTHYGAIGDGRTDCYGPLQTAIDDAKRRNLSFIYVPMGRYIYTGELINMEGITFIGNPHAKIVNIRTCEEIPIEQFGWMNGSYYSKTEADGRFVKIPGDTMTGSLAIGPTSTASGNLSFAQGEESVASGKHSHAQGWRCTASGMYSFAGGTNATASGFDSIAYGNYVTSGEHIGDTTGNQATGNTSIALGCNTVASGSRAISTGYQTTASGNNSRAEGNQTISSGQCAHAEGDGTIASGDNAHAEGKNCIASGAYAHAENGNAIASGNQSHAEGWNCTASYNSCHAEGTGTTANTQAAHAEGYGTVARGCAQHAEGYYNVIDTTAEEGTAQKGTYLHIVGNSPDGSTRSNAHTIDWSGNGWFSGDVYVGSTSGTNRDSGSKKLATEKSIIMGQLDENYEPTGDVNYDIPVVLAESSGGRLSISNNKVTIGAGVSKVKISTTVSVYADTAGAMSLSLKQGNTEVAKVTKGLEANEKDELNITNFILSVSENDTICACAKVANGDVVYGVNGIVAQTWITVEEI